jgi:TRAP-type mannitol/chloroaromatic compound transport system permease large subunit
VVGDLVKTTAIFRGVFWFIVMDLILVAILCAFPQLVLTLPEMLG